ncbi:MAG TPA: cyanophycinase [Gemmatimonadaceae bacterium]|nr:cyanophycinase [Gemmatimonadaceae bacterium]
MPTRRSLPTLLATALLIACAGGNGAPQSTTAARQPRGYLLIVGGGPQPHALVQRFVDLAGGSGHARIIVFPMASVDGEEGGRIKADDLQLLGARATSLNITRAQANSDSVAQLLDSATGIWFGGGDQDRLFAVLHDTKVEAAIHARYQAGAVVGGTSAGAAVMSSPMITGEERHPGGARPDTSSAFMTIARNNIITAPGFGFLTDAIVDQHFLRRKRHNRLLSLVLEGPVHLGVGIDESTGLLVYPDGHWEVLGASAALVYDARHSAVTPPGAHVLGATGVVLHVLPAGSRYDPASGHASLPTVSADTAQQQ